MFEQTFKNIDDILHKDAGCSSELDYVEQTSWILFLKYLDDFETGRKMAAELSNEAWAPLVKKEFRWSVWAAPKKHGKIDYQSAMTGDDLKDFVDHRLFPYFKQFKADAENPDTIKYKVGEIFSELKNRLQSGYNLREVRQPVFFYDGALRRRNRAFRSKSSPAASRPAPGFPLQSLARGGISGSACQKLFL